MNRSESPDILTVAPKVPVITHCRDESRQTSFEESCSVLDLISKCACNAGQATALKQGEERLTYNELEVLSNQIARYLMGHGIRSGSRVAIFLERTLRLPATILGILKAGGAWVPLDPIYPAERLQYMIEDCGAVLLFTERRLAGRLQTRSTPICEAEVVWREISAQDPIPTNVPISPSSIAYVIYTSGTTGKPKGVMIEHSNLAHYVQSLGHALGVTPEDVYLHTASFAFSSSVRQLFLPLSCGAEVVLARSGEIADPLELFGVIAKADVTIIDLVPTYWAACTAEIQGASESERRRLLDNHLRLVLSASEALWSYVPCRWREVFGSSARLINMFGQTETCGIATIYPIPESLGTDSRIIPVGKPIRNMYVYLMDAAGHPVPVGVAGEVYVGGPDVGLGYLGLPDLTKERFVSDPCRPDWRLYRTGDLGRMTPSGDLEFLGRQDSQVKIRGHRIELAEIEAVLRSHRGVSEAAAVVREIEPGEQQLAVYFSEQTGCPVQLPALREHLRRNMPDYMLPAVIMRLERLPLTPNGKLDRKALPLPDSKSAGTVETGGPRNDLEQKLVRVWEELLKRSRISIHDDFFELGGHSLLAVRLFSKIEKLTKTKLPLVTLFEARTIERLARVLRNGGYQACWTSLVPIKPNGTKPRFYCVHGVGGNIVEFQDMSRYVQSDQPLYGIQAQGLDGKRSRHNTVEEMAAHYAKEIRDLQPAGPYYLGGSSFGGLVAYEVARQLMSQGEKIGILAMFDTRAPGLPKWLPKTTALRKKLSLWRLRFDLHWSNFRAAEGREKIEYLAIKSDRLRWQLARKLKRRRRQLRDAMESWLHPKEIRQVRGAGHQANRLYQPNPCHLKITLLRATEQPHGIYEDRTNGWSAYAQGGVEVHDVPGHHGSIMREPRARILAETLMACLNEKYQQATVDGSRTM